MRHYVTLPYVTLRKTSNYAKGCFYQIKETSKTTLSIVLATLRLYAVFIPNPKLEEKKIFFNIF